MNREDIIKLAREVGLLPDNLHPAPQTHHMAQKQKNLERFAALVAAAEREKVAEWMTRQGYATGHGDTIEDLLKELEWQIRESEREACAKVCDAVQKKNEDDGAFMWEARNCAAAIRARGEA